MLMMVKLGLLQVIHSLWKVMSNIYVTMSQSVTCTPVYGTRDPGSVNSSTAGQSEKVLAVLPMMTGIFRATT